MTRKRTKAMAKVREGIRELLDDAGHAPCELEDLADAFDAFESFEQETNHVVDDNDPDVQAARAYKERFGRDAHTSHAGGNVWAVRSLDIPDHTAAIIAYALRNADGTWELFPLPPKNKWGMFR